MGVGRWHSIELLSMGFYLSNDVSLDFSCSKEKSERGPSATGGGHSLNRFIASLSTRAADPCFDDGE